MSVNLVNGDTLDLDFTAIANTIRTKTGSADTIPYSVGHPENIVNPIKTMMVMPTKTVRGAIASFDGENAPLKSLNYSFLPFQSGSGDPSPSNIRPIVGVSSLNIIRCKKNFFNEDTELGTINDTTGVPNPSTTQIRSKTFSHCKGGQNYSVKVGSNNPIRVLWYDSSENFISETINITNTVITAPDNASLFKIRGTNAYGTSYQNDVSINYPSSETSYEAYSSNTYPVSFGTTVYGGEGDESGNFDKTWSDALYFDGSVSVNAVSQSSGTYFVTVAVGLDSENTSASAKTVYSDKFVTRTGLTGGDDHCYITNSGHTLVCILADQTITTKEQATQWFADNPTTFVYKLATPTSLTVDSVAVNSVKGTNNIYLNVGNSEVEAEYYTPNSGSVTPIFSSTVLVDNSAQDTSFTLSDDYENYDFIEFEITSSTLGTKRIVTIPEVITDAFTYSSGKFNLNFWNSNNYCCYSHSGNTWTRTNNRYSNITKVTGIKCTNATVSKTMIFEKQSISATGGVITSATSLFDYDYLFFATCTGDATETQPCNTPICIGQKEIMEGCTFVENKYNQLNTFTITEFAVDTWVYWFMCVGIKFI